MTQGEAVKQLRDERQQAERKEAQLKVWRRAAHPSQQRVGSKKHW